MSRSLLSSRLHSKGRRLFQECNKFIVPHPNVYYSAEQARSLPEKFSPPSNDPLIISRLVKYYFAMHGSIQFVRYKSYLGPLLVATGLSERAEPLRQLGLSLGGSILRRSVSYDLLSLPRCKWLLYGNKALSGARALASLRSPFQARLNVLAELEAWPTTFEERNEVRRQMNETLWDPSTPLELSTLEDVAHLFDVSGTLNLEGSYSDKVKFSLGCPSREEADKITLILSDKVGYSLRPSLVEIPSSAPNTDSFGRIQRVSVIWRLNSSSLVTDILTLLQPNLQFQKTNVEVALGLVPRGGLMNLQAWYNNRGISLRSCARLSVANAEMRKARRKWALEVRLNPGLRSTRAVTHALEQELQAAKLESEIRFMRTKLRGVTTAEHES